uniref:EML-like second beta-propeller domain-containing protein n=1 Tax=Timema tahoe TaxID=61484 RepID=A0A7R9IEY6_9NEOP|nr:unnamed protein product [Timema tahoe]
MFELVRRNGTLFVLGRVKMAAVSERGDRPSISIYDLGTLKRKRVLNLPSDMTALEFVSLSFTHDGKCVAAVAGEPDWMLMFYNWEKGKIDSMTKANNLNNPGPVVQVACNPSDSTVVCVVGPGLFRLLALSDTVWRQYGYQKAEMLPITCVCWIAFDRILAGTKDGRLVFVESGELKAIYRAMDLNMITFQAKDEPITLSNTTLMQSSTESFPSNTEVRELLPFPKGFAYACGSGQVHLFERESNQRYRKRNVFRVPVPEFQDRSQEDLCAVQSLSVNITQDKLLATTLRSQLYSVRLWGQDQAQVLEVPFKMVGEYLHHGPVIGLATCAWKPIFLTCGHVDRTVRVWNYEEGTQELVKQYQEDLYCVALHPTGLFTVIGFSDKLRFMILLIDDIQPVREFPVRSCQECVFSTSGHLFAAVNGNVIQMYSSVSFQNIYNLKGHNGKVRSVVWTNNDQKMVTCGTEGAVYEWDITTGKRVGEIIAKACIFTGVAVTSEGKSSYGVGSDGLIREISNSAVVRAVDIVGEKLDCIALSRSDLMLFIAGASGSVISLKFPLVEPSEFNEYNMHSQTVTKMRLTHDDQTLITCSEDGTVCLWKLSFTEGRAIKMDKDFAHASEILIGKEDLEDKNHTIKDLTQRMHELHTEHSYQTRQNEVVHTDKLKEVHASYCQARIYLLSAIEELKEKNEQIESDHTQEMNNINSDIAKLKNVHEESLHALEASYNAKLIVEYDKYHALEERLNRTRRDYEDQLASFVETKVQEIQQLNEKYHAQLRDKNVQLEELHEEARQQVKEHEEIKQQLEDDADREIIELRTAFEKELKEERENITKLRGETGVMRKKYVSSQKEIEESKHQVHMLQQEQNKFQQIIMSLERDIADLKKEINERDGTIQDKWTRAPYRTRYVCLCTIVDKSTIQDKVRLSLHHSGQEHHTGQGTSVSAPYWTKYIYLCTIQDKEKRIYDLKRKNQELEKYKFVLNYKIKELKNQIEPKDRENKEKKEQIQDVSWKNICCDHKHLWQLSRTFKYSFNKNFKTNNSLELQLTELKEKLYATDLELEAERQRNRENNSLLRRIRIDLHNCSGLIQEPNKLKESVKNLYHKYSHDQESASNRVQDVDAQTEFMRQREHLERTVASLKRQVMKGQSSQHGEGMKIMEENVCLIAEINNLRRELRLSQRRVTELHSIMTTSLKIAPPKDTRLGGQIDSHEESCSYKQKIEDCEKTINLLKEEIQRLVQKLNEQDKSQYCEETET